jgi:hypothetical protein
MAALVGRRRPRQRLRLEPPKPRLTNLRCLPVAPVAVVVAAATSAAAAVVAAVVAVQQKWLKTLSCCICPARAGGGC